MQKSKYDLIKDQQPVAEISGPTSTPEQIAQRKIIRVSKQNDGTPALKEETNKNKINFQINLPPVDHIALAKLTQTDPSKLFMNNNAASTQKYTTFFPNVTASSNLFTNNGANKKVDANQPQEQQNKSEQSSKQSKTQKVDDVKQKPVDTQKKPQQEKQKTATPSLFGFATNNNIFSGLSTGSGGLFAKTGPSIFDFKATLPPTTLADTKTPEFPKQKEDDQSDGQGGYKQQSQEIDQTKVINDYVYDLPYNKLIQKPVIKFKKDSQQTLEHCTATLQKHKQTSKQTKTILFQGEIIPKASSVKIINNNSQNLNLGVVGIKDGKPKLASVRLQFEKQESGSEFLKVVEGILNA